ncbi:MAG: 16S rRNA (cytosine(1402)-N(4))-methyltransferase RsmH [Verrucomicrobiae bacterium]|nr:16S rRNA (cytosine(1402)-N(4))-methyltransferase RsmH [Verrucomicrobiae bacterium]
MKAPSDKPGRRPRYRGTHPRRFEEKYKEHHPDKYPETIQKVIESGKTPAGTHRPICVQEIMEILAPKEGEVAVDCTLGYGGHSMRLLPKLMPGGRLIGLDVDPMELPRTEERLREMGFPADALTIRRSNFAGLPRLLAELGLGGVDMVLSDLGCSSMQLDNPARGFSFKLDGPLDLRMNPNRGQPVSALLAKVEERKLVELLRENADEPHAERIAAAIIKARSQSPILTTATLTRLVRDTVASLTKHADEEGDDEDVSVRRVFQALRIEVNEEFNALETFLRFLPTCLNPGGRVAILTFHSGEDRRVKKSFQAGVRDGIYSSVANDVIRPSPEEIRSNPRASSAKLRWAVRSG